LKPEEEAFNEDDGAETEDLLMATFDREASDKDVTMTRL